MKKISLLVSLFLFSPFLLLSKGKKPKHLQEETPAVQPTTPATQQEDALFVIEEGTAPAPSATETLAETETVLEELPAELVVEEAEVKVPEGSTVHVVWIWQETQDCLWHLARQYYGDPWQWKKIYEANRNQILDANRIFPKQRIVIPSPSP